jgi:ribosomal protein S12 methylthiotransferase
MSFTVDGKNKINFTSLGCPRNLVDSEVMLGILLKEGYEVTENVEDADYLIVNTCAFLESSRKESTDTIEELFRAKKEDAKVVVTGCMVSKHRSEVESLFPKVHYFLGSGDVEGILQAVKSEDQGKKIGSAKSYLEAGEIPRKISTPKHYAYLKIAEGCRKGCAYCIIPKIKGPLRSKSVEQIVKEFRLLLDQGVKEVILIAQDLGDWGKDQGLKEGGLAHLLREILKLKGDYWLRLLYLYPDEITDELIEVMKSDPRICAYLDMPIQHINNTILKNMRRHTTGDDIKKIITKLRAQIPEIHIRTSLIVGFPGETDEQFEELAKFVQKYPLNHVGIFKYSREEGTPSAAMLEQVPEEVKEERWTRLMKIQEKMVGKLNKGLVGSRLEVIVEGYHPETNLLMVGRYFGQCPEIDGVVILNDPSGVQGFGERYIIEITGSAGVDLIGHVIAPVKIKKKSLGKLTLV